MYKNLYFTLFALLLGGTFFITSCASGEGGETPEEVTVDDSNTEEQDARDDKVKKIIYSIPSPVEMASLLQKSGVEFDGSILNPTDNANKYSTAKAQALNLGIYGADLRYTSMFEQDQQSLYYVATAKKLSGELGVEDALDDNVYQRLNDNRDDRDSLLSIVSDSYRMLNRYLRENAREEISALVITGGWVEGLYIACKHYSEENEQLAKRIAEQKYVLSDLMGLLSTYEDKEILSDVIADMADLDSAFDSVELNKGKTETSTGENGIMVIGGESSYSITAEDVAAISAKIESIRANYIQ
jgi:hypothetical protein